jgi:hypothetical protein
MLDQKSVQMYIYQKLNRGKQNTDVQFLFFCLNYGDKLYSVS